MNGAEGCSGALRTSWELLETKKAAEVVAGSGGVSFGRIAPERLCDPWRWGGRRLGPEREEPGHWKAARWG